MSHEGINRRVAAVAATMPQSPPPSSPATSLSSSPLLTYYALEKRALWGLHVWRVFVISVWIAVVVVVVAGALSTVCLCCERQGESVRHQAYEIAKSVDIFKLAHGRLPVALSELTVDGIDGHRAIMEQIPRDPWGNDYRYVRVDVDGARDDVLIWSAGEDGVFMTDDDIGNWQEENTEGRLVRRRR